MDTTDTAGPRRNTHFVFDFVDFVDFDNGEEIPADRVIFDLSLVLFYEGYVGLMSACSWTKTYGRTGDEGQQLSEGAFWTLVAPCANAVLGHCYRIFVLPLFLCKFESE